jgi:GntR family transcriptional regulator
MPLLAIGQAKFRADKSNLLVYYARMTANDSADIPVYLKLRGLLAASILEGNYAEGDQLPSVRTFAADHGANPLTVAKAYQALQDDGYVSVRRGVGMFVADGAIERLRVQERDIFLNRVWPRMRAHIERLGIDPAELIARQTA